MSIRIDKEKCIRCGKCIKVCPGSLIYKDEDKKAYIKYEDACWGCTACLKECGSSAITYFLGNDIGGAGGAMQVKRDGQYWQWEITDTEDNKHIVRINTKESNKY
ncbi:4Fe-4S dicluster domain-containing protein [Clostridium fungisolvens]|uniref:Choline trimethylamine-lyase activating enzyme n=1 Tax=Clostridium fungisolvens TaxID=1604897 RepID=A0A6V8SNI5_9CLOT|nr:4Fe-4S binding protein [Clostridium fungisolvens]GFP78122.1 Choline trimethylamine-lyase activating enzyme [Clostridium fungisolvens]